jgi:hypothetical protein
MAELSQQADLQRLQGDELVGVFAALVQWERRNPLGRDFSLFLTLCTWLLRGAAAKPVGGLYKQTGFSEPIMRRALK